MPITPEDRARQNIDKLLTDAGWIVQDKRATNLSAGRGVAVGEFRSAIGVVEAKKNVATTQNHYIKTASPDAIAAMRQFSEALLCSTCAPDEGGKPQSTVQ